MAMTKKERAEVDATILRWRTAASLRWTEPVARDLPAPADAIRYTQGYDFNLHTLDAHPAWSGVVAHGNGVLQRGPHGSRISSGGQGGAALFSTRLLALRALRHALEQEAAAKLLKIDQMIEAELNDTPTSA